MTLGTSVPTARRAYAKRGVGLALVAAALGGTACPGSTTRRLDAVQTNTSEPAEIADTIYEGGLKGVWQESGSAVRELADGAPAKIQFGIANEWVLTRPGLGDRYGGVMFRVKEPIGEGEFIELRLGSGSKHTFPPVKLKPDHRTEIGDGWTQVFVPMAELDPDGAPFDRITFRPFRPFSDEYVFFDHIALAKGSSVLAGSDSSSPATPSPRLSAAAQPSPAPGKPVRVRVACDAKAIKISPYIYGAAAGDASWSNLGLSGHRWGGNPLTRYNWELNVANHAQDWFFENYPDASYSKFIADNDAHQTLSAITVPTIGWVAKDGTSYAFPVSVSGAQAKTDPWRPDVGNGVSPSGSNIPPGPPSRTSVEAPPAWIKRWVTTIHGNETRTGKREVYEYILDNEPMLWSTTHRDIHPEPTGYDELLDRTIQYGTAIREADPDALIAGPAEWGWSAYFYSSKDLAGSGLHLDRLAHGNVPLQEWYLRKLSEHERTSGVRLLDIFDLHYYPQANGVYGGGAGGSDRETQLLRLRSTRSLWDPTYVDESWIKDTIRLLPRMREWVDKNYPGRGISIGEWNFGGEKDVTGALATAETLGRFAQFGVTSAYYWTAPVTGSSSSYGFLGYRNFDGRGGHFLDWYVPTTSSDGTSVFASRDSSGTHMVLVAINMNAETSVTADVDLSACGAVITQGAYVYSHMGGGFAAAEPDPPGVAAPVTRTLPPWSITVMNIHLTPSPGHSP